MFNIQEDFIEWKSNIPNYLKEQQNIAKRILNSKKLSSNDLLDKYRLLKYDDESIVVPGKYFFSKLSFLDSFYLEYFNYKGYKEY